MATNKPSSSKAKSQANDRGPTQNDQSQTQGHGSSQKSGLIYDPDMDVHEVRQLRSGYRDLLSSQACLPEFSKGGSARMRSQPFDWSDIDTLGYANKSGDIRLLGYVLVKVCTACFMAFKGRDTDPTLLM